METQLDTLLDEISLQLVLVDTNSPEPGLSDLRKLLAEFASKASKHSRMCSACTALIAAQSPTAQLIKELGSFVSKAQNYLRAEDESIFPEASAATAPAGGSVAEVSESLDREFLVEFIEKHTTMLDEFEGTIVEFKYAQENDASNPDQAKAAAETFRRFAKGYIHTIKGDAGSIGMTGIEKTCHFVEDHFSDYPPETILETLLSFKEWLSQFLKDFAAGNEIRESSEWFRNRFVEMLKGPQETTAAPAATVTLVSMPDLPDTANLDLLAELMADENFKDVVVIETAGKNKPAAEAAPAPKQIPDSSAASARTAYQLSGDQEVFQEFVVEADEHLEIIESTLLNSGGRYSNDNIAAIFRGIHSIKGASSFYTLKEVTETSHVTETLLDEVRQGKRQFDQGLTELLLNYIDLEQMLLKNAREALSSGGTLYTTPEAASYMKKLAAYQSGKPAPTEVVPEKQATSSKSTGDVPAARPVSQPVPAAAPGTPEPSKEAAKAGGEQLEVKNYVKVETQRLDLLIDSIGEMCIYSSVLIQRCRNLLAHDEDVSKLSHQVEKFSKDLQNIGMTMRLIPIRGLFQKMSRLVWDTARKMGKDIKFQMDGEDTELDRTIIDKLADPLMHMVRNALDHGVEPGDERQQKGKPRTGHITLSAEHSGGSIHIKIKDDGRGLDTEKLLKKAREKGVVAENQQLSKSEIYNLIFAAGFSTAAVVTDISGRGVGMDVVKRNIEALRGRVRIESEVGKGTEFTIELPLTLAIIDGIQVSVGPQNYIIPTLSIVEFMRPTPEQVTRTLNRGETFHFRGKYLPVYSLARLFGIPSDHNDMIDGTFIVVETAGEHFALAVDRIDGTVSTVIKNLGEMFEQRKGIAGCAVMANGSVALILDAGSLLHQARSNYAFVAHEEPSEVVAEGELVN